MLGYCERCGDWSEICVPHNLCPVCCPSGHPQHWAVFDADELGLDPETDNFPGDPSRA